MKFRIQNCKFYLKFSAKNFKYFLLQCISSPMTIRFTLLLLMNYEKVIYTCYLIPYGVNYTFFLYFTLYGGKVAGVADFIKYFQLEESEYNGHQWRYTLNKKIFNISCGQFYMIFTILNFEFHTIWQFNGIYRSPSQTFSNKEE